MSLIIDALKKAQQLRLKESKNLPFFKDIKPPKEGFKKIKLPPTTIGIFSILLFILFLSFSWYFSKPKSTHIEAKTNQVEKILTPPTPPLIPNPSPDITFQQEITKRTKGIPNEKTNPIQQIPKIEEKKVESPIKAETKKLDTVANEKVENKRVENEIPSFVQSKEEEKNSPSIAIREENKKDLFNKKEIISQFNLATSLYNQRDFLKAIQAYQKVIEMDPTYIEAFNNLGLIYLEIGDFDRALKNYERAIEINPRYEKALNNIGILYFLKGEDKRAMEVFEKLIEINPNHVESYIHLGIIYKKIGQWQKGIESYQKALTLQPQNGEAHYNLGILYENIGDKERALYHYQQFIQISEKDYPDLVKKVSSHMRDIARRN